MAEEKWAAPPDAPRERFFKSPPSGRSVGPEQYCPGFHARFSSTEVLRPECWFCRYADFHLDQEVTLDVGTCRFPTGE